MFTDTQMARLWFESAPLVRGFTNWVKGFGSIFASTPEMMILILLMLLVLAFIWIMYTLDIAVGALHTGLHRDGHDI